MKFVRQNEKQPTCYNSKDFITFKCFCFVDISLIKIKLVSTIKVTP